MAFIGSINAETRRWLGNNGPVFDGRQVYVGCSGAFTVEALISKHSPKAKIWGNDVSLYSSVLGAYLSGQPFNISVREDKFAWLAPYLADEEAKAATVMVLFEALKYEKDKNLFQHRHWAHYLNNFESFHQGTVAKLQERKKEIRLEAYTSKDIFDLLDEIPKDAVAIAFLPTYAGGYERMFKRLKEIFDWDSPSYGLIDEDRKKRILTKMMERDYLYLDDHEWKGLPMVAVDGKVFGFLIYSRMQGGGDVYLLADFVVNSTRYRRLAKLLLLVTQTREVRRLLEEKFLLEIPKCRTMVFTDKPVSMKYRGLYELARRNPGKLVYETELGILDGSEVIPLWLKKFEKS